MPEPFAYRRIKTMENSKAVIPWSGHGRLREENNCSDFTMIFWCFGSGWVVMYEKWSLMRGGHTWRSRLYNNITIIILHSTLKQPRPAGSSISLSNPRAQRLTRPSTCDMSPGMLLKLWMLWVLELMLSVAFKFFFTNEQPRTVRDTKYNFL